MGGGFFLLLWLPNQGSFALMDMLQQLRGRSCENERKGTTPVVF